MAASMKLAFPSAQASMCLLTDASNEGFAIVVTQVREWREGLPVQGQHHELLFCASGTFTGAQQHWSVIEKEAYPIVTACERLTFLLQRSSGFRMYCDHRNLIHVFAPGQEVRAHVRGKLLRWARKLSELRYTIEHIDGVHNVWSDMLSRWIGAHPSTTIPVKIVRPTDSRARANSVGKVPRLRPFDDGEFTRPTASEITRSQDHHKDERPRGAVLGDDQLYRIQGRVWIPRDKQLLQRIFIIAHCGPQGH